MTISRKAIRQQAGAPIGAVIVGTATDGNDKSLVTAHHRIRDDGVPDQAYQGWWLTLRPGDVTATPVEEMRQVDSIESLEGRIKHKGAAWDNDPAASDEFELNRYHPDVWTRAINLTLSKCFVKVRENITGVANQLEYALASYTWIDNENAVKNVFARVGDTTLEYAYSPQPNGSRWYNLYADESVFTLEIDPAIGTTDTLIIEGQKPYAALSADLSTTTCPDELVIAGSIYHLYYLLSLDEGHDPSSQGSPYAAKMIAAFPEYSRLLKKYAPRFGGKKFQFPRPYGGPMHLVTSR